MASKEQNLLLHEYRKQQRRIQQLIKRLSKKGFTFDIDITPTEPETITKDTVDSLKRITPSFLITQSKQFIEFPNKGTQETPKKPSVKSQSDIPTPSASRRASVKVGGLSEEYIQYRTWLEERVKEGKRKKYIPENYKLPDTPSTSTEGSFKRLLNSERKIERYEDVGKRYYAELERLLDYIEKGEAEGYKFKDGIIPNIRTIITEKSIERLQNLTEKDIYKGSKWFNPKTGKWGSGKLHKFGPEPKPPEKPRALPEDVELFGPEPVTPRGIRDDIIDIDIFERISEKILTDFYVGSPEVSVAYLVKRGGYKRLVAVDVEGDKFALLDLWRDSVSTYTETEEGKQALYQYVKRMEPELAEALTAIHYCSTPEDYTAKYAQLKNLLAVDLAISPEMEQKLGAELDALESGEPDYAD